MVAFREVLRRLVEENRSQARLTPRIVKSPVVDVIDELIFGDGLERHQSVLSDETQDAKPVRRGVGQLGPRLPLRAWRLAFARGRRTLVPSLNGGRFAKPD